jgi:hypothetical protein
VLFSNRPPSTRQIILYFLTVLPFVCPSIYTTGVAFCSLDNSNQIDYAQYWYQETRIPQLLVTEKRYQPFMIFSAYMLIISVSSYILSIILAKLSLTELKNHSTCMSQRARSLQNQLARYQIYLKIGEQPFRTLFAQSLSPLCKF